MKTAIISVLTILTSATIAAPSLAGSATLNSTYRETGNGTRWSVGTSQTQGQTSVQSTSTSVKGEYGVPAGQTGARQWAVQVGINPAGAYCNGAMSNGGDPYVACATDTTKTQSFMQFNSQSMFGENSHFRYEQNEHRVGAGF